ncbi:hypothetical protein [Adhaeribacter radiodurans]|uniref:Uncharacterized protein n=1 Tax=Adhaeribacter radiodurans TaxID=2745197 RepID=A0A7L7LC58_9BACT|nr:hypothetical protein [Adhaeribacter radiodurans]QMU30432.1 hypothetical protein HUW48_21480 [Adhaeribacter radiodurans]
MISGYLLLAFTYHAAEYTMRFYRNIPLFLGLLLAVVIGTYAVAKRQGFKGQSAWRLQTNLRTLT